MSKMFILRGCPGAGKSTFAKKLKDLLLETGVSEENIVICESDDFFMRNGEYKWNPRLLGIAHKTCQEKAENSIASGKYVIVANTNIAIRDLNAYIKIANKYNVDFKVYRLMNRFQNVHEVPAEKVESMNNSIRPYTGEILVHAGDTISL